MSYRAQITPLAQKQIRSWGLSDFLLVEVYLWLRELLPLNPSQELIPWSEPGGGMRFLFSVVDPEDRMVEHTFLFQVYYHPDEATLLVTSGVYRKQVGA